MVFTRFEQISEIVKSSTDPKRMAVAAAADEHTLEAAIEARSAGLVNPVLVGDRGVILSILNGMGDTIPECDIMHEPDGIKACETAVRLVREGQADFLMKGNVETSALLKAVVNKESGLGRNRTMSHIAMFEAPGYHKLLTIVDGGMIAYPTLEQKKQIIENTVDALLALGYERPKVGVLACVEKVNEKMPETLDACELAEMNERGEIKNCIVNGPISYDCAVDKEIATFKDYFGEVAGDVDVLVAPNIHTGNIMGKILVCTNNAKMAGFVVGAACPIVVNSRSSSAEEKLYSIMLSAAVLGKI